MFFYLRSRVGGGGVWMGAWGSLDEFRRGLGKISQRRWQRILLCFNFFIPCEKKKSIILVFFLFFQIGIVADVAILHTTTKANLWLQARNNKSEQKWSSLLNNFLWPFSTKKIAIMAKTILWKKNPSMSHINTKIKYIIVYCLYI